MGDKLFLSGVFVVLALLSYCNSATTASDQDIPANVGYFNTKTRYQDVNTYLRKNILAINRTAVQPPAPNCIPVHLTAIVRHGTRYPTTENIRRIGELHELVTNEASGDLSYLPELKAWKMWYKEDMGGLLVANGRADQRHLAERLVKSFPSLLTKESLLGGRVKFITSSVSRCVNSTIAFQQGLKDMLGIKGVDFGYTKNDTLMRYFQFCERFVKTVLDNKDAVIQATLFKEGPEMRRVRERLSHQLQIPYEKITYDITDAAYYLCAYQFSILGVNSPWCNLFDRAEAEVMDYASDLGLYWTRGYGHEINSKASCILFHDLFDRLETALKQTKAGQPVSEVVTVEIGHAETLLPLMTLLGLFKGKIPLLATNFESNLNRAFNGSHIMPFIGNLMAALYDCPDGFRMQVRVNENPVTLPGLSDPSPLYEDVRERYRELLEDCNEEAVCRMDK